MSYVVAIVTVQQYSFAHRQKLTEFKSKPDQTHSLSTSITTPRIKTRSALNPTYSSAFAERSLRFCGAPERIVFLASRNKRLAHSLPRECRGLGRNQRHGRPIRWRARRSCAHATATPSTSTPPPPSPPPPPLPLPRTHWPLEHSLSSRGLGRRKRTQRRRLKLDEPERHDHLAPLMTLYKDT